MLKLSILSLCFVSVFSLNAKLLPEISCNDLQTVTTEVLFSFFKDQAFITVVDFNTGLQHSTNAISCNQNQQFRPLDIYNSNENLNLEVIDSGGLSSYPTSHGYFIQTNLKDFENGLFEKLAKANPKICLMINIVDLTLEESKNQLKIGYEKYKMLNTAALCTVRKFGSDESTEYTINICLYNPFREEFSDTFCIEFDLLNLDQNLKIMENFRRERIENLQGYNLKVNIFEYDMKSVAVFDKKGKLSHYTYPDGEILNFIARYMNFTPVYIKNDDGDNYGYQDGNGNFTGSLAALEYEKADLVANPRLIADYNTEKSVFLQPITMTKLFFTIKKRETMKKISFSVFSKLDFTSRVVAITLVVLFPLIYYIINRIEVFVYRERQIIGLIRSTLYVFGILNNVSVKHTTLQASRIIALAIMFFALMTSALFQGTILKDIKTIITIGKITEIDQLYDQDFQIAMQPALTYVFGQSGSSFNILLSLEDAVEIMKKDPKIAYLLIDLLSGNYLDQFYDNVTGENSFEVVPESAFQFYIAMMAPKSSPFNEVINQVINIYVQTGLYDYHTKKAIDDNEKMWIYRMKNGLIPKIKSESLKLSDFEELIKLFFILNACALAIFILEFVTGH